jgi:hypothetical protein
MPAAGPATAPAATPAASTAPHAIAHQASLHLAQRFQLLDRFVGLLLLVVDGSLPLGDLRLQNGSELLDRVGPGLLFATLSNSCSARWSSAGVARTIVYRTASRTRFASLRCFVNADDAFVSSRRRSSADSDPYRCKSARRTRSCWSSVGSVETFGGWVSTATLVGGSCCGADGAATGSVGGDCVGGAGGGVGGSTGSIGGWAEGVSGGITTSSGSYCSCGVNSMAGLVAQPATSSPTSANREAPRAVT